MNIEFGDHDGACTASSFTTSKFCTLQIDFWSRRARVSRGREAGGEIGGRRTRRSQILEKRDVGSGICFLDFLAVEIKSEHILRLCIGLPRE